MHSNMLKWLCCVHLVLARADLQTQEKLLGVPVRQVLLDKGRCTQGKLLCSQLLRFLNSWGRRSRSDWWGCRRSCRLPCRGWGPAWSNR